MFFCTKRGDGIESNSSQPIMSCAARPKRRENEMSEPREKMKTAPNGAVFCLLCFHFMSRLASSLGNAVGDVPAFLVEITYDESPLDSPAG